MMARRKSVKKYALHKRYLGMTCAELRKANELRTKMRTLTLLHSVMDNENDKNTVMEIGCLQIVSTQGVLYLELLSFH